MTKYHKRPVEVEAKRWNGDIHDGLDAFGANHLIQWVLDNGGTARFHGPMPGDPNCPSIGYHDSHVYCPECDFAAEELAIKINTLEGTMTASPWDWIIKGVAGEFYPCKPAIFEQTYEEVTA